MQSITYIFAVKARSEIGFSALSNTLTINTRDLIADRKQWCLSNGLYAAISPGKNQPLANSIMDRCIDYYGQTFVDVNEIGKYGFTVLHWCAYYNFESTTAKLLEYNAKTDI